MSAYTALLSWSIRSVYIAIDHHDVSGAVDAVSKCRHGFSSRAQWYELKWFKQYRYKTIVIKAPKGCNWVNKEYLKD